MSIFSTSRGRCGLLAADSGHLESNRKLIGRPVPEISSFEICKMEAGQHLRFDPTGTKGRYRLRINSRKCSQFTGAVLQRNQATL